MRHIEIDLGESGLTYQPGDALGVYYTNSPALVDEILAKAGLTGDEIVEVVDESLTVRQALIEKFEITASNPQQVAAFAELSGSKKLQKLAEDKDKLRQYANNTQVLMYWARRKQN